MSQSPRRALVVIDVQNEYVTGNLLLVVAWKLEGGVTLTNRQQ